MNGAHQDNDGSMLSNPQVEEEVNATTERTPLLDHVGARRQRQHHHHRNNHADSRNDLEMTSPGIAERTDAAAPSPIQLDEQDRRRRRRRAKSTNFGSFLQQLSGFGGRNANNSPLGTSPRNNSETVFPSANATPPATSSRGQQQHHPNRHSKRHRERFATTGSTLADLEGISTIAGVVNGPASPSASSSSSSPTDSETTFSTDQDDYGDSVRRFMDSARTIVDESESEDENTYHQPGAEQGADAHIDQPFYEKIEAEHLTIVCVDYCMERCEFVEVEAKKVDEFLAIPRPEWSKVRWIHMDGVSWSVIKALANHYNVHPLAVEDIFQNERIKADYYDQHLYASLVLIALRSKPEESLEQSSDLKPSSEKEPTQPMYPPHEFEYRQHRISRTSILNRNTDTAFLDCRALKRGKEAIIAQLSLLLTVDGVFMTFVPRGSDLVATPIFDRLKQSKTVVRTSEDPSFLVNCVVDVVVDHALPVVDFYATEIARLEMKCLEEPKARYTKELHLIQSELHLLKRTLAATHYLVSTISTRDIVNVPFGPPGYPFNPIQYFGKEPGMMGLNARREETESSHLNEPSHHGAGVGSGSPQRVWSSVSLPTTSTLTSSPRMNYVPSQSSQSSPFATIMGGKHAASSESKYRDGTVDIGFLSPLTKTYLRDVLDHTSSTVENIDSLDRVSDDLINLIFNTLAFNQNKSMSTLTIANVIFLPLSFLSSIYGMNFTHIPELEWKYGYIAFWVICVVIVLGLIWYFRSRKWFVSG